MWRVHKHTASAEGTANLPETQNREYKRKIGFILAMVKQLKKRNYMSSRIQSDEGIPAMDTVLSPLSLHILYRQREEANN